MFGCVVGCIVVVIATKVSSVHDDDDDPMPKKRSIDPRSIDDCFLHRMIYGLIQK